MAEGESNSPAQDDRLSKSVSQSCDRPQLKDLYEHVVPSVADKWRDIGVHLLPRTVIDNRALTVIAANHSHSVEGCCKSMFEKWLETQKDASWSQLIKVIKTIGLLSLASKLEKDLPGHDSTSAVDRETISSNDQLHKLRTTEDLEVEFAIATDKIKQALCNSPINVTSVIEQLQTFSVVRDKNVPLLDKDVFESVTTVEKLWQRLSRFWSIYNYDMLRILLRIVKCKRADDIFKEFLSRIDVSAIEDMQIVAHFEVIEREGSIKPLLRIKVKAESCTNFVRREVEEVVSSAFNLEKYILSFKGIKEGCIELIYEISNAMMLYFLQCKFIGYDLAEFAAHDIISIHINDMELIVPSKIDMDRQYEWLQAMQTEKSALVQEAVIIDCIQNKKERPEFRDLNRYVIKKHSSDWEDIGIELKLEYDVLKTIAKNNSLDSTACLRETLNKWLKLNTIDATWKTLEIALTNVNRTNLGLDPVDDVYGTVIDSSISTSSNQSSTTGKKVKGAVIIDCIQNKKERPTFRDLNRYVIKKHSRDWEDIGIELKLEYDILKTIGKDNHQDSAACLKDILDKWLKLNTNATWETLEVALTNVNRANLELNPVDDVYGTIINSSISTSSNQSSTTDIKGNSTEL